MRKEQGTRIVESPPRLVRRRELWNDPTFQTKPFDSKLAEFWLVSQADEENTVRCTLDELAKKWSWLPHKVQKFLHRLNAKDRIALEIQDDGTIIITIIGKIDHKIIFQH